MAEKNSFADRIRKHISNLGELSLSILEFYVKKVIGDEAVEILRAPYEDDKKLEEQLSDKFLRISEALSNTEKKLKNDLPPQFFSIPLKDIGEIVQVASKLEDTIDFEGFQSFLVTQISSYLSDEDRNTAAVWAEKYVNTLKVEIIASSRDASFAERISATTLVQILEQISANTEHSESREQEIIRILRDILNTLNKEGSPLISDKGPTRATVQEFYASVINWQLYIGNEPKLEQLHRNLGASRSAGDQSDQIRTLLDWCFVREKVTDLVAQIGYLDSTTGNFSGFYRKIISVWSSFPKTPKEENKFQDYLKTIGLK